MSAADTCALLRAHLLLDVPGRRDIALEVEIIYAIEAGGWALLGGCRRLGQGAGGGGQHEEQGKKPAEGAREPHYLSIFWCK
jgi:hypothetical protein